MLGMLSTLLASACTTTELVPVAYRVPLAESSKGPTAAANCVTLCEQENQKSPAGFYACLGSCPDLEVERRTCEPPPSPRDSPPVAACFTRMVEHDVPSSGAGEAIAEGFFRILGDILVAAIDGAAENAAEGSSHSSHGSHSSHARGGSHGSSSQHSHVAAHPHRVN